MAQVLAEPGDVRHGFSYYTSFNHDFGRITGIAATRNGNILLCDYDNKNLILVDSSGNMLKKLNVDSEPYDLTITSQNIGFISLPNTRSVLQIDPDRMVILFKATCDDLHTNVLCVSAIPNTGEDVISNFACFLGIKRHGSFAQFPSLKDVTRKYVIDKQQGHLGSRYPFSIQHRVVKFHALDENAFFTCKGGQNYITYSHQNEFHGNITIATMDTPSDMCDDDYKHIYISGQESNNIHRLKWDGKVVLGLRVHVTNAQDWKVIDIPLDSKHGINKPVAMCFNKTYTKLYIVNEWGKLVLVFDVI
ncbi:ECO1 [Mytilus edulis]|uniref:ESCO n=1 Tax=Mytilus edulis TaxID=6550 RepID=A0A8S3TBK6_MYTED|nr:ECO1 [Mytilus edulis]